MHWRDSISTGTDSYQGSCFCAKPEAYTVVAPERVRTSPDFGHSVRPLSSQIHILDGSSVNPLVAKKLLKILLPTLKLFGVHAEAL